MSELMKLIEQEIPEGRQNLQDNFSNLEKVAQYCQENYLTAADKKKALEETKNFTTHSLASVAYQINNLATNFLKLLDLQQSQLAEMESNVNHLAQTVNIHKEKVARREIGLLTTNRSTTRPLGVKNGIIFPEHGERPTKYLRKNIDYTQLDEIGHGVKSHTAPGRSPSISSGSSSNTPAPAQQPPTPPSSNQGSIGRASGQYMMGAGDYRRPAPVVAPPNVPGGGQYGSMQHDQQGGPPSTRMSSNYAPSTPPTMGIAHAPPGMGGMGIGQMGMGHHPLAGHQPPIGISRPMSKSSQGSGGAGMHLPGSGMMQGPPPPPPGPAGQVGGRMSQQMKRQTSGAEENDLPPPPPSDGDELPPPERESFGFDEGPPPPPPPQFNDQDDDQQHPEEDPYAATGPDLFSAIYTPDQYLEKVIAIYDYQADKEDELTFSENSVIYVLKKNDDGWYEGVLNGKTGLFPGNYVEGCI